MEKRIIVDGNVLDENKDVKIVPAKDALIFNKLKELEEHECHVCMVRNGTYFRTGDCIDGCETFDRIHELMDMVLENKK